MKKIKQGAPLGNKNRVGKGAGRGKNINLSMPREEWEAFCAAADLCEGHALSDDEYLEVWRRVDRLARKAFVEQHQGNVDPEILIV